MKSYLGRMKAKDDCPPRKPMPAILWSWLGSLAGIYATGICTPLVASRMGIDGAFLLGSFGASAVLVYGAPLAEFSQPRNLVGGSLISALIGVAVATNIPSPESTAFAAAVAVSSSVLFMHLTRSMHPPGGATALIAVVGGESIRGLGYWYVLFPVACGCLILLAFALVVNNMSRNPHRHYPVYWF